MDFFILNFIFPHTLINTHTRNQNKNDDNKTSSSNNKWSSTNFKEIYLNDANYCRHINID